MTFFKPKLCFHDSQLVPFVGYSPSTIEIIGAGMFKDSSLMGTFPLIPPKLSQSANTINRIMFVTCDSYESDDPWIIVYMDYMPLSLVELDY